MKNDMNKLNLLGLRLLSSRQFAMSSLYYYLGSDSLDL